MHDKLIACLNFFLVLFSVLLRFCLILSIQMKRNQGNITGLEQTIDAQYPVNFWLNWQKYRSIRCRERLQSFEDQKFYHNYNIHSAGMQDKLGYLLANLVYHIMVQAYKANLGLLVLSGAGFGHHLLFSGELTPKLYILHVVAVQRTTYVLCTTGVLH